MGDINSFGCHLIQSQGKSCVVEAYQMWEGMLGRNVEAVVHPALALFEEPKTRNMDVHIDEDHI